MGNEGYHDLSNQLPVDKIGAGITILSWKYPLNKSHSKLAGLIGLSGEKFVRPFQTHSKNVEICTREGKLENTDGIVTAAEDLILTVRVADCIPFFLVDMEKKFLGMVHAGWRGVVNGIIPEAVNKMREIGSDPGNIFVLAGPSMQQCCFEIGPEVAQHFSEDFLLPGRGDRYFLNSVGSAIEQFLNCGISVQNTKVLYECTVCSGTIFHSYRRDGDKSGRMIAMLGLKS